MKGLFIPEITAEEFRNGCLESIEALMAEGEIYDIEYSKWIPVSEKLPEKDDLYLAYFDDGEYELVYCCKGTFSYSGVVAWMPLPAPFKSQESEG